MNQFKINSLCSRYRRKKSRGIHVLSMLFSAFLLIGISYSAQDNWDLLFSGLSCCLRTLAAFIGFSLLLDAGITFLYDWLSSRTCGRTPGARALPAWIEMHCLLFCFLAIFLCWLPYLVVFFPGSVPADGYRQLSMYFGGTLKNTQHTLILTLLAGFLMQIGRTVSDNAGVFLIALCSSLFGAFCYAGVCFKIHAWKAGRGFFFGSLAFYCLVPMFGAYAQTVIKDSIFTPAFSLFFVLYLEFALPSLQGEGSGPDRTNRRLALLTLCGLFVSLCRNNGIFLILPAMLLLPAFRGRKFLPKAILTGFLILAGVFGTMRVAAPALGYSSISSRVLFSIPFQQTARYLRDYPDDVTEEEKEAIDAVLDYDSLTELYNPDLSDPVKKTYRTGSITTGKLLNYFRAWFTMFLRHPDAYVQATLNGTYGYYYPFATNIVQGTYRAYMFENDAYQFDYHYTMPKAILKAAKKYLKAWTEIPILNLVQSAGTYTWFLLLLAGYLLFRRHARGLLLLAAPFINVLVCIASPVNGLPRYAFPVMAAAPALLLMCLRYPEPKNAS